MFYNRHSIRLPNWDYSDNGYYFVTICTHKREYIFGEIENDVMILNTYGDIVNDMWNMLSNRYPIELDTFQIMPNHVHMVFQIVVGAHHDAPSNHVAPNTNIVSNTRAIHESPLQRSLLSQIIGYFKMNSSKLIHQIDPNIPVWQRNYYERVIRNEIELNKIRRYIEMNPVMWDRDRYFG